jgi:hypothetical protein
MLMPTRWRHGEQTKTPTGCRLNGSHRCLGWKRGGRINRRGGESYRCRPDPLPALLRAPRSPPRWIGFASPANHRNLSRFSASRVPKLPISNLSRFSHFCPASPASGLERQQKTALDARSVSANDRRCTRDRPLCTMRAELEHSANQFNNPNPSVVRKSEPFRRTRVRDLGLIRQPGSRFH